MTRTTHTDATETELQEREINALFYLYRRKHQKHMKESYVYAALIAVAIVAMIWGQ